MGRPNQRDYLIPGAATHGAVAGLPVSGRCVLVSHSERDQSACALRWWYRYSAGIRPVDPGRPLRYGRAWHLFLEDLHTWWMHKDAPYPVDASWACAWCGGTGQSAENGVHTPCSHCGGTGNGPVRASAWEWEQQALTGKLRQAEADDLCRTLSRAVEGYLVRWGFGPPQDYKVVAVERPMAGLVRGPDGAPFRPVTWVIEDDAGYRLAGAGEAGWTGARKVRWPVYQVGVADAVYRHRTTNALWVYEGKSAASPKEHLHGMLVDPQAVGYCWLLRESGLAETLGSGRVAGWWMDAASSQWQADPRPLKAGGFSVATPGTVTSWRFIAACGAAGVDPMPYAEYVRRLMQEVDPKLYARDWLTVGDEALNRYSLELYGHALRLTAMRRASAEAPRSQAAVVAPRTPVCRARGGRCDYRGPCVAGDNAYEVPDGFELVAGQRWNRQERLRPVRGAEPKPKQEELPWI